jgi:hypothetical protein
MVAEQAYPLDDGVARTLLRVLDALVDMGDRRAAALQISETFKDIRVEATTMVDTMLAPKSGSFQRSRCGQ